MKCCPDCGGTGLLHTEPAVDVVLALCLNADCAWMGPVTRLGEAGVPAKKQVTSVRLTPMSLGRAKMSPEQVEASLTPTPLELDIAKRDLLRLKEELNDDHQEAEANILR